MVAEGVAPRGSDDVLVEDVGGSGMRVGEDDAVFAGVGFDGVGKVGGGGCSRLSLLLAREELVGAGGEGAAAGVAGFYVTEFDLEDGGLDGVEAGVPAYLVVVVAAGHAVGAEGAGVGVYGGVAGGYEAGVSEGAEVFGRVEAEGRGAEGSGRDVVPGRLRRPGLRLRR